MHSSDLPDEPRTPEDAVTGLMMALGRRMRQRQPGDAIDFAAFPVLKVLSHQGPMRLSALAQILGLDASTVSRHAKQLEDRGLLERTDDPDDRRASRVTVSTLGRQSLDQALAARHQIIASALSGWSEDERESLRRSLHRLVTDLSEVDAPLEQTPHDQTPHEQTPHDQSQETSA